MPSKSSFCLMMFSVFQPMCGTLTVLGKLTVLPLKSAKPFPGPSSLVPKKSCSPKQIPSSGVPSLTLLVSVSLTPPSFEAAGVKAPTPGKAIASAAASSYADVPMDASKPTFSNAVFKLSRLPTP